MSESRLAEDLQRARAAVVAAELTERSGDRYLAAHLAALQVAAVVLSIRAHPATARQRARPRNAWQLLSEMAPEFAEWAAFFAATEGKREAVRAGATAIVSSREADDLVRDAQNFLAVVERAVTEAARRRAGSGSETRLA